MGGYNKKTICTHSVMDAIFFLNISDLQLVEFIDTKLYTLNHLLKGAK